MSAPKLPSEAVPKKIGLIRNKEHCGIKSSKFNNGKLKQ
jgi:hypothetical protein